MTQWAVPTSDVSTSGWTNQDDETSSLYLAINEAADVASGSDYVESPNSVGATATFGFGGVYTPASGTVTLYIRAQWGTASETGTVPNVAFLWDAVSGADDYKLRVGTSSGSYLTHDALVGDVTNESLSLAAGTYYWIVQPYQSGSPYGSATVEQSVVVT